jgi:hypothetical protein
MCDRVRVVVLGIGRSRDMCDRVVVVVLGIASSRDMCDRVGVVVLGIARVEICVTELGWWSWE